LPKGAGGGAVVGGKDRSVDDGVPNFVLSNFLNCAY
jgi:hypothetical protein